MTELVEPDLSIVIPAFNVQRYIIQAIQSAINQTLRNLEIIVVDDGSTDSTGDLVNRFDDPRIRYVRQSNRGLSAARNTGISLARSALIGFLDGDDTWKPQKADEHLQVMRKDRSLGITFSNSIYIDEYDNETGQALYSDKARPGLLDMVQRNHVGNGSSPIIRKECFELAGLFDEELRSCEDWEMWVRILAATPYRAQLIPAELTCYRVNPLSLSQDFEAFTREADKAALKISRAFPWIPDRVVKEGQASSYRITATKAMHAGNRRAAASLMYKALSLSPALAIKDCRTIATVMMLLMPTKVLPLVRRLRTTLQRTYRSLRNS